MSTREDIISAKNAHINDTGTERENGDDAVPFEEDLVVMDVPGYGPVIVPGQVLSDLAGVDDE